MRDVAAFARFAQPVAFDGFGQDHGRLALGLDRRLVGGVDLLRIVAAATEALELLVREVAGQLFELGIFAKEVLANVAAGADDVFLVFAVDDFAHPLHEQAGFIRGQQRVPIVAPDDLDDVPAGAAEAPSSSWMILPLPRTGPSSRCRLQLMTKIRLSSFSREASVMAPSDSGSSHSPSPKKAHTRELLVSLMPRSFR